MHFMNNSSKKKTRINKFVLVIQGNERFDIITISRIFQKHLKRS